MRPKAGGHTRSGLDVPRFVDLANSGTSGDVEELITARRQEVSEPLW